jgi:arginyl-tRNA synthetase
MKHELEQEITRAVHDLFATDVVVELTRPEEQFGDYATNVALQLAKPLGKSPRDIATELADHLRATLQDSVREITVAGPGFLNLTLTDYALEAALKNAAAQPLAGKTVVAEYSDPNPFKVLHAGHLYTTLTGDAISRLLERAGASVHRVNFGGDVGLHVGKTMWAIVQELGGEQFGKLADISPAERLDWLSERYVSGNNAYEDSEQAKAEITDYNKQVYEIHSNNDHESAFAQIYWTCRQWSYDGFDQLYEQLGVKPFERYIPESETTPLGLEIVKQGLAEGVFEKSEGAVVFKGEPFGLHTRVFLNSNGLPTYEAKDLGLAATKWDLYKFDLNVIITGSDIIEYMKVVLKALESFYPEVAARTKHLTHGNIKLPGGVKMSSRKGNVLRAIDILDAAKEATLAMHKKEDPETTLGAVKYAFLKQRIGGDIIYDSVESVSLEGNSGPYLQYAHARARSILRKYEGEIKPLEKIELEAAERSLVRKITEYAETVEKSISDLMPHHICVYLYELAQAFNRFYEHNRVMGDEREAVRLSLVEAYADTLKDGLELLGIYAPEQM